MMLMTAKHVMSPEPITLEPHHRLYHALELMHLHQLRHIPIVDENMRLYGVVSDRDVKRWMSPTYRTNKETLKDRMSLTKELSEIANTEPVTVAPDTDLSGLLEVMLEHQVGSVLVVSRDEDRLLGIITRGDLLKLLKRIAITATQTDHQIEGAIAATHHLSS